MGLVVLGHTDLLSLLTVSRTKQTCIYLLYLFWMLAGNDQYHVSKGS